MNKKYKEIVSCMGSVLGILAGLLLLKGVITAQEGSLLHGLSTSYTKTYVIAIMLSFAVYMCICALGWLVNRSGKVEAVVTGWFTPKISLTAGIAAIVLIWAVVGIRLLHMFEAEEYACMNTLPVKLSIVVILAITVIAYISIIHSHTDKKTDMICYIIYTLCALSNAVYVGVYNTMAGEGYSLYHNNAVNQTIYNVYYNTPFSEETMGVYGHYALFFKLPMKIFGTSPLVIGVCMAIGAFLFVILSCLTVHWIVDSNAVRILTALAIVYFENGVQREVYWMTIPIRWIFPSILLCYGAYLLHKNIAYKRKHFIIGCVVCSLGVLWNLESGVISCLCWAFYCLIRIAQENKLTVRLCLQEAGIQIFAIVLEILAAVQIVNIYNFFAAGFDWSQLIGIHGFFFPLIGSSLVSATQTELMWGNYEWIYIYALFFGCCSWALFHMVKDKEGITDPKAATIGFCSLCGIGLFTYYFNRTIAGTCICYLQVVLCNAWVADYMIGALRTGYKNKKIAAFDGVKIGIGGIALAVLCVLLYAQFFAMDHYSEHLLAGLYDYEALEGYAQEIAEVVPEDTYAFGMGTAELYGQLGWDTRYHLRDFPNIEMLEESTDDLRAAMRKEPGVFVESAAYSYMPEGFTLVKEFTFGYRAYGYFKNDSMS